MLGVQLEDSFHGLPGTVRVAVRHLHVGQGHQRLGAVRCDLYQLTVGGLGGLVVEFELGPRGLHPCGLVRREFLNALCRKLDLLQCLLGVTESVVSLCQVDTGSREVGILFQRLLELLRRLEVVAFSHEIQRAAVESQRRNGLRRQIGDAAIVLPAPVCEADFVPNLLREVLDHVEDRLLALAFGDQRSFRDDRASTDRSDVGQDAKLIARADEARTDHVVRLDQARDADRHVRAELFVVGDAQAVVDLFDATGVHQSQALVLHQVDPEQVGQTRPDPVVAAVAGLVDEWQQRQRCARHAGNGGRLSRGLRRLEIVDRLEGREYDQGDRGRHRGPAQEVSRLEEPG